MPDNTVEVKITGDASGVKSAMKDASAAVKSGSSEMQDGFNGVGGAIEEFKNQLSTIAASTGITAISELVRQVEEVGKAAFELTARATDIANMSEVLNVSTSQFQVLGVAADEAGVGQEKLFRGTERLVKILDEARKGSGTAIEQLRELGFSTEQIGDKSFGTADMLGQLRDRMNDTSTATDTLQGLVNVLGGRAALVALAIKALPADMKNLGDAMKSVNGLTDEQIQKAKDVHSAWSEFGTWVSNTFTKGLLALGDAWHDMTQPLKDMGTVFGTVTNGLQMMQHAYAGTGEASGLAAAVIVQKAHEITKAELDALQDRIAGEKQGSAARLALVREYYEKAKQFYGSGDVDTVRAAHRELIAEEEAYQAEILRKKKEAISAEKTLIADEQALIRSTTADSDKLLKEIVDGQTEQATAQQANAVESLSIERDRIQKLFDLREIDYDQKKALETKALADEYAAEKASLELKRQAMTGQVVEQQKIDDQLLLIDKKYHAEVDKLDTAADIRKKQLLDSLNQGFNSSLSNFLKGAETLGDGLKSLMGSVLDSITNTLADLVTTWLTQHVAMAFATKAAAATSAGAYAGVAGAAGIASFAGAPWPIDIGAPAFGASMATAAEAFQAATFAASGGFDIPQGVNPVTQLHSKEMVLPAHLADPMRQFLSGGKAGGAPVHLHVHAVDGQSVKRLFNRHGHVLADQMKVQMRRFRGLGR